MSWLHDDLTHQVMVAFEVRARFFLEVVVRRQRLQARIVDSTTDREVVDDLEPVVLVATHHLVGQVVEESTDARRADALGFGFEVERLPDESSLPVQSAVEPRSIVRE